MICISGSCKLDFDDGYQKKTIFLKNNTVAVKVAGGIWGVQKYLKEKTILLVFSDGAYDEKDYLRDYDKFKKYKKKRKK